jgi:hypothetical protein
VPESPGLKLPALAMTLPMLLLRSTVTASLLGVLGLWLCLPSAGFSCDSSTCSLVTRGQNGLLGAGVFRLDLSYRYTDASPPLDGSTEVAQAFLPKVRLETGTIEPRIHQDLKSAQSYLQLDFGYGITARTSLLVSFPLLADHTARVSHVGFVDDYQTIGVGDLVVGARQLLGAGFVGGVSVKAPTGADDSTGDYDGSILDPELQPGTGSWGLVGSLQRGGRIGEVSWTIAGSYQANTTNSYGYRFGGLGLVAVSAQRALVGGLSGSLQVKFVDEGRSTLLGQGVPSTGSRIVYVAPGFSCRLNPEVSTYGLVLFAPLRDVNDEQLGPHLSVLFGVSKTFRRP